MKNKAIVGGLVVVVVLFAAGVYPLGWRAALTRKMIAGDLSGVSWGEFLREVRPGGGRLFVDRRTGDVREDVNFLTTRRDGSPCAYLWETSLGSFWGRAEDRPILGALIYEQLEDKVYSLDDITIVPGDVVFDVGSHLGVFTKVALTSGASKVVAIEPEPVNNSCFKQTYEQEIRDGRVILVEAAAWHSKDTLRFSKARDSWAGLLNERGSIEVKALTIDDIVDQLALDRVDFIKLDIEGAERHALSGARKTLARFGPDMAVAFYHLADDPQVIREVVTTANPVYSVRESSSREHGAYVGYFTTQTERGSR